MGDLASAKRGKGRPKKDDSNGSCCNVRLTDSQKEKLEYVSGKMGKSKSDIIRAAINMYCGIMAPEEY